MTCQELNSYFKHAWKIIVIFHAWWYGFSEWWKSLQNTPVYTINTFFLCFLGGILPSTTCHCDKTFVAIIGLTRNHWGVHPPNSRYRLLGHRYHLQISFILSQILFTMTTCHDFRFNCFCFFSCCCCCFSACECNGHADSCDAVTGTCNCLARYVTGKNCERYILFCCDYIHLRTVVCFILVKFDCARSDVV